MRCITYEGCRSRSSLRDPDAVYRDCNRRLVCAVAELASLIWPLHTYEILAIF